MGIVHTPARISPFVTIMSPIFFISYDGEVDGEFTDGKEVIVEQTSGRYGCSRSRWCRFQRKGSV